MIPNIVPLQPVRRSRRLFKSSFCVWTEWEVGSFPKRQASGIWPPKTMERYHIDGVIGEGAFGKAILCSRIADDKVCKGGRHCIFYLILHKPLPIVVLYYCSPHAGISLIRSLKQETPLNLHTKPPCNRQTAVFRAPSQSAEDPLFSWPSLRIPEKPQRPKYDLPLQR